MAPQVQSARSSQIDFSFQFGDNALDHLQQLNYPDLTATVDDWALQGVDTAFFGNLMSNCVLGGADRQNGTDCLEEVSYLPKTNEDFFTQV